MSTINRSDIVKEISNNFPNFIKKDISKLINIILETIRDNLINLAKEMKFTVIFPKLEFCGDNAAMIAWAGIQRFKKNLIDNISFSTKSRWPLDDKTPYMKGPGLKLL